MPLISESGSLLNGIYQLTYRFIRQKETFDGSGVYDQRYSKWSLPTEPVRIFGLIDESYVSDGQIGRITDNRIQMYVNVSDEEIDYYTHYQVAVLRRNNGQYLPPTEAFLLKPIPFSEVDSWPSLYELSSNYDVVEVPVSDITIDFAPISSAKTISSKNSRAFLGNISYYNRKLQDDTSITVVNNPDSLPVKLKGHTSLYFDDKAWVIGGTKDDASLSQKVYSSDDLGLTWSEVGTDTLPVALTDHSSVVFNSKMWIIGGSTTGDVAQRKVYSSTDGITWTEAGVDALPVATRKHTSLLFNSKMWVIGGYTTAAVRKVYSSSDGITWAESGTDALPVATYNHASVIFFNKLWVIGGNTGASATRKIYNSIDGTTWEEVGIDTFPFTIENHTAINYSNSRIYVIGGNNGTDSVNTIYTSIDGIVWNIAEESLPYKVEEHTSLFFNDTTIYSIAGISITTDLPDGSNWDEAGTDSLTTDINQHEVLSFNSKLWVIGGEVFATGTSRKVYSSTDGITWTEAGTDALPQPLRRLSAVVFDSKMWVIGGFNGSSIQQKVYNSTDGITWSEVGTDTLPIPITNHTSVVFNSKMWIIGGSTTGSVASRKVYSSGDGITWTESGTDALPVSLWRHDSVVFNNIIWTIGGTTGNPGSSTDLRKVYKSSDGLIWTEAGSDSLGFKLYDSASVSFNGYIFIMGGIKPLDGGSTIISGSVYRSQDGISWTEIGTLPVAQRYHDAAVLSNKIFSIGGDVNASHFGEKVFYTPYDITGVYINALYSVTTTGVSIDNANTISITKDIGRGYENNAQTAYNSELIAHKNTGYFRDEVYRFGITYVDKYGNWSPVRIINFKDALNNSIQDPNSVDWRFPVRDEDGFEIFNTTGNIEALGLRISNIDNHPEWAIGFSIVRAKRRKNILFQTPLVPCVHIQPPKSYPGTGYPQEENIALADYAGTLQPKSHYYPIARHIKQSSSLQGECEYTTVATTDAETKAFMVFPSTQMYKNVLGESIDVFNNKITYFLNIIDAAGLIMNKTNFGKKQAGGFYNGDGRGTHTTATFHATTRTYYYYERGESKTKLYDIANLNKSNVKVLEFGYTENFDESGYIIKSHVEGLDAPTICDYRGVQDLQATDLAPDILRSGIIIVNTGLRDPSYESFVTSDATVNDTIKFDLKDNGPAGLQIPNSLIADLDSQSFHADESNISNVVLIANITSGLEDTRYGDIKEFHEFIPTQFTKTGVDDYNSIYLFSELEQETIAQSKTLPVSVDVFGGDCYISRHLFKISDSIFHLSYATAQTAEDWGDEYTLTNGAAGGPFGETANFDRPVSLDGCSQIIDLYLESEVNGDAIQRQTCKKSGGNSELLEAGEFEVRTPFDYLYNLSYSVPNSIKIFTTEDVLDRNTNEFGSRIVYSNPRVDFTEIEGFDEFPVLNTYDLENRYGNITKLINFSNRLYSFQQDAFAYLPVESRVIQTDVTTDELSVRSAQVIDLHQYASVNSGSQHQKSIIVAGDGIVYADAKNKKIVKFSENSSVLSKVGLDSEFKSKFSSTIPEHILHSEYDFANDELLVTKSDWTTTGWSEIWNDLFNCWTSELEISTTGNPMAFAYIDKKLYNIGIGSSGSLAIYKMYDTSVPNSVFMGNTVTPYVEYTISPSGDVPVVFDNFIINADKKLDTLQLVVNRDPDMLDYDSGAMDITIDPRDHVYKIKTVRNTAEVYQYTSLTTDATTGDKAARSGQRISGTYGVTTIKWPTTSIGLRTLSSVAVKYRVGYGAI